MTMSSSGETLLNLLLMAKSMSSGAIPMDTTQKELFGMLLHTVDQYRVEKENSSKSSSPAKDLSISTSKCGLKDTQISVNRLDIICPSLKIHQIGLGKALGLKY